MQLFDEDSLVTGAIAGLASFVVGFAATVFLATPEEGDDLFDMTVSVMGQSQSDTLPYEHTAEMPAGWKVAGWIFHDAHFASIDANVDFSGSGMADAADISLSFAAEASGLVQILPFVLLAGAGFFVASRTDAADVVDAATNGAHVVVGYLPLAIASVFLLSWETSESSANMQGEMTAQPELLSAVLFTGILIPVVLGAIGGAIAFQADATSSDERHL